MAQPHSETCMSIIVKSLTGQKSVTAILMELHDCNKEVHDSHYTFYVQ